MKTQALYIHIPFCGDICTYCDFAKVFYRKDLADRYLERLAAELKSLPQEPMRTIFIGGGTPSVLSLGQLRRLMAMCRPFCGKGTLEFSVEVNPESMDDDKLDCLLEGGVSRLSVGAQTFNDDLLERIHRRHKAKDALRLIKRAKEKGMRSVSVDLMYGLPDQIIDDCRHDLDVLASLPVDHVSYYDLILEEGTILSYEGAGSIDDWDDWQINRIIDETLARMGFAKYEISNYAKQGHQSLHNSAYWHYDNYYGVGVGATGKIDDTMYTHSRALGKYLRGEDVVTKEVLTKEETMFNHVMMSLRLSEGLDLAAFKERYGIDALEHYAVAVEKNIREGRLIVADHHLHASREGLYVLNDILVDFLDENA